MVTRKNKIRENPIPTWDIQHIEALAVRDGWYISDGDELLFVDRFANTNDFSAALHKGDIEGVAQDDGDQDNDNNNGDINTYVDPDNPPRIALETAVACGKISGVPSTENPVKLPGLAPPKKPSGTSRSVPTRKRGI